MTPDAPPLVLHVIHHLVIGGMENGLVNLINTMPASQYRHAVVCIEDYSEFRQRIVRPDVEVIPLHRSRIGVWKLRREIYRVCRNLRPAIVHSRNLSGLDALLPGRLAGVPYCVHGEHGWDVDNLDGRKWKPALLRRLHSPLVDRYITVSRDLERYLVERVGIAASRITHICNGVDTDRFVPRTVRPVDALPAHLRSDELMLIGTVGRIQPVKDQSTLLRAFSLLLENRPDLRHRLRLIMVGDGPLLGALRRQAESLKLTDSTWFPGAVRDVPEILRALDVFVLPSLNEGISNTILEAMSAGIPIVASAVGGNPELVEEGICGRLFPARDLASLSRILAEYASDTSLCREHGRAARQIALERYSLKAMVAGYQAIYDSLCRGDASTPDAGPRSTRL